MKKNGIAKVVKRVKLREQKSDFACWQSQPPSARLKALEEIRQEYHRWKYGAEPRLQRVYTIVKRMDRVDFINLENLKKNKRVIGRHQDLADVENLE